MPLPSEVKSQMLREAHIAHERTRSHTQNRILDTETEVVRSALYQLVSKVGPDRAVRACIRLHAPAFAGRGRRPGFQVRARRLRTRS